MVLMCINVIIIIQIECSVLHDVCKQNKASLGNCNLADFFVKHFKVKKNSYCWEDYGIKYLHCKIIKLLFITTAQYLRYLSILLLNSYLFMK